MGNKKYQKGLLAGMAGETMIRKTGADGLRAIACVLVIVNHWGERLNTRGLGDGWAFFGALVPTFAAGVSLFFVLSGFLLAGPFWEAWFAQQPLPPGLTV